MYEESVFELIYRLSRLPLSVYTEEWELKSYFGAGKNTETAYDSQIFRQMQQCLGEKKTEQAVLSYHEQVPIGLYGCRSGGRIYILGPFCYGPLNTVEAGRFVRRNKLGDYPACRMEDARNVIWFLLHGGENETEWARESGQMQAQAYDVTKRESVTEEVRQMEVFQKNHTYQEEERQIGRAHV